MWYESEAYKKGLEDPFESVNPYPEHSTDFFRWEDGKKEGESKEAIGVVWRLAERKHQDECYEKDCGYCRALGIIAKRFPEIESSRKEYYMEKI